MGLETIFPNSGFRPSRRAMTARRICLASVAVVERGVGRAPDRCRVVYMRFRIGDCTCPPARC